MTAITFIGLGNMGAPMAANLVRAGHVVAGFDLSAAALDRARAAGVSVAADAGSAVADTDVVVTMLPAGDHVVEAWTRLVPVARPGTLFIDCSTIDVARARAAHDIARATGMPAVDAPVSGGTAGAEAGTLTFMAGGEADALALAEPILVAMGRNVIACGGPGAGQAAKICNNMILGISMIGVSEAFVLAERLGLTHQVLFDVVSTSSGQCWSMTSCCPVPGPLPASPANNGYKPGFATKLMLKDMLLAAEAGERHGVALRLGRSACAMYSDVAAAGDGDRDFSTIVRHVRGQKDGTNA